MDGNTYYSKALVGLLTAALLAACPGYTFAQALTTRPIRTDTTKRTKANFNQSNEAGWAWVAQNCTDATADKCAAAAIQEATTECSESAVWFKKDTRVWQLLSIGLLIMSAGFTGVGASTTIANAKVWSTLGGTTGLGAVTSTLNANVANDQTGLATVNTALAAFLKYVTTGGAGGGAPANDLIYKAAPIYAGQCTAAANASSGTASK